MTNDSHITVTAAGQLVGPPEDGHHCVFANLSDRSTVEFIRSDLLSARPELKTRTTLDFEVTGVTPSNGCTIITSQAVGLDIPLVLISTDLHQRMDRLPVEPGKHFRVALSQGFA